jgi:hypothetical protein
VVSVLGEGGADRVDQCAFQIVGIGVRIIIKYMFGYVHRP